MRLGWIFGKLMENKLLRGRKMELKDLLGYENVVIQCHDNPDPDALASDFGLYRYFSQKGKTNLSNINIVN